MITKQEVLEYHAKPRPGKTQVNSTKPTLTQRDLSLAYTPGVAIPSSEIAKDPQLVNLYTNRSNLVAVVTNGTRVLGLGNIGPKAAKPVMEGKAVLFKRFADIDVFDIELAENDPQKLIAAIKMLEPTVGGINLEDIRSPDCFFIEQELKNSLGIPVFHDDQHGTAIIATAALRNALLLANKKIEDAKVVISGAGAAGIAIATMITSFGVQKSHLIMCDSSGVIYEGRPGLEEYKRQFCVKTHLRTLKEAMVDSDVFIGISTGNIVTSSMIKSMAQNPIVFALANPVPEISYEKAKNTREDLIMATGRSDSPNQVNNVLGFPFIFRGALDVGATIINEEMKKAAALALADLAQKEVPEEVQHAYGEKHLRFGPEYIIPTPFDPRLLLHVAPAVAKAAMDSGVATRPITDWKAYRESLQKRLSPFASVLIPIYEKARSSVKRVVFVEGDHPKILQALERIKSEGIANPILLGDEKKMGHALRIQSWKKDSLQILDPKKVSLEKYAALYKQRTKDKRSNPQIVQFLEKDPYSLACLLLLAGDADAMIGGGSARYEHAIHAPLRLIRTTKDQKKAAGTEMIILRDRVLLFADTALIIDPTVDDLVDIGYGAAKLMESIGQKPVIAYLSFRNKSDSSHKCAKAAKKLRLKLPGIPIEGEIMADVALDSVIANDRIKALKGGANILIFPTLEAGNIAYKLVHSLGVAQTIGPLLVGMAKPVNILTQDSTVENILNVCAMTVAQCSSSKKSRE